MTWVEGVAGIISASANIGLNFIFIPLYGQHAAALTTLGSTMIYSGWIVYWSQRIDPITINIKYLLYLSMVGALGYSVVLKISNQSVEGHLLEDVIKKTAVLAVCLILIGVHKRCRDVFFTRTKTML